jgi:hypothetical protein
VAQATVSFFPPIIQVVHGRLLLQLQAQVSPTLRVAQQASRSKHRMKVLVVQSPQAGQEQIR